MTRLMFGSDEASKIETKKNYELSSEEKRDLVFSFSSDMFYKFLRVRGIRFLTVYNEKGEMEL